MMRLDEITDALLRDIDRALGRDAAAPAYQPQGAGYAGGLRGVPPRDQYGRPLTRTALHVPVNPRGRLA